MAKRICTLILIVSLFTFIGCQQPDTGRSRLEPPRTYISIGTAQSPNLTPAGEIDIVEDVEAHRQAYKQALEMLVRYYEKTGNNTKLNWAQKELNALNVMLQYNYVIPGVNPKEYRQTTSIREADMLYEDALAFEQQATPIGQLVVSENAYRLALGRFEQLIKKYPTSDKIDDAAYKAGVITEHFRDYMIALDYYQSAYTWDPDTPYPARFRAARILDKYMHRNAEALTLYKEAIKLETRYDSNLEWRRNAEERIRALEKVVD
jgi:tetratricopeptide (TPR) repeat protein